MLDQMRWLTAAEEPAAARQLTRAASRCGWRRRPACSRRSSVRPAPGHPSRSPCRGRPPSRWRARRSGGRTRPCFPPRASVGLHTCLRPADHLNMCGGKLTMAARPSAVPSARCSPSADQASAVHCAAAVLAQQQLVALAQLHDARPGRWRSRRRSGRGCGWAATRSTTTRPGRPVCSAPAVASVQRRARPSTRRRRERHRRWPGIGRRGSRPASGWASDSPAPAGRPSASRTSWKPSSASGQASHGRPGSRLTPAGSPGERELPAGCCRSSRRQRQTRPACDAGQAPPVRRERHRREWLLVLQPQRPRAVSSPRTRRSRRRRRRRSGRWRRDGRSRPPVGPAGLRTARSGRAR